MFGLSVREAAAACGGILVSDDGREEITGQIEIDSRNIGKGDIFAAFKGDNTDGHDYINSAVEKGAVCVLAEHLPDGFRGTAILTDDVQNSAGNIAAAFRSKLSVPVVGITGSVGKTTAKEMVYSVLSQKYRVLKTKGNLNNQLGVPMSVSSIRKEHDIAVIEMGISGFGEMRELASVAQPTAAVFTVIGHAHLEFLHDLEGVFKAKTEMLEFLSPEAPVAINGDDEYLKRLSYLPGAMTYGMNAGNMLKAENVTLYEQATECLIKSEFGDIHAVIPAYGRHMIYAALEGAAMGFSHGLNTDEITKGIASYSVPSMRGTVEKTQKYTLINDTYNANPDSMKSSIDSLALIEGRHVAILGDMLELGERTAEMHYGVGRHCGEKGIDLVVACGKLGRYIYEGASSCGVDALYYANPSDIIPDSKNILRQNDVVLIKGSRGMHLESIVNGIKSQD